MPSENKNQAPTTAWQKRLQNSYNTPEIGGTKFADDGSLLYWNGKDWITKEEYDKFKAEQDQKKARNAATGRAITTSILDASGNLLNNAVSAAKQPEDPQQGSYARQALISEQQAAKSNAQASLAQRKANQDVYQEDARQAETQYASQSRNKQKAYNPALGGAGASFQAAKETEDTTGQHVSELRQRQDTQQQIAAQQEQIATSNRSAAEGQRAQAIQANELYKQNLEANERKKQIALAQGERAQYDRERQEKLDEAYIASLGAKSAADQASAAKSQAEAASASTSSVGEEIKAGKMAEDLMNKTFNDGDIAGAAQYYAAHSTTMPGALSRLVTRIGKNSAQAQQFYKAWKDYNMGKLFFEQHPEYSKDDENNPVWNILISDSRMKNILNPNVKSSLLRLHTGRTM